MSTVPPPQDPYGQQPYAPPVQGEPMAPPPQQFQQVQYPQPPQPGMVPYAQKPKRKYANVVQCPRCGSPFVDEVRYAWWGGVLGPSMLSLMKCPNCKLQFSGKTLQDAKNGIIIYNVIALVLAFVVFFVIFALRH